ncbi:unnamed protein product [Arabidopsis lyrata]|nr:unnamed protein product [Arabidopsis lyrata]
MAGASAFSRWKKTTCDESKPKRLRKNKQPLTATKLRSYSRIYLDNHRLYWFSVSASLYYSFGEIFTSRFQGFFVLLGIVAINGLW